MLQPHQIYKVHHFLKEYQSVGFTPDMLSGSKTTRNAVKKLKGVRNASQSPFDFNQKNSMRMQKSPTISYNRGAITTKNL